MTPLFDGYKGHRDKHFGHTTYAQHGDDLMICCIFSLLGIKTPTYLDLGAHHPLDISNTALLYERGSHGVNVEANPRLLEAFNVHRPRDINVALGIGLEAGRKLFYMFSGTCGRNTFSADEVRRNEEQNNLKVKQQVEIEVVTVKHIIETFCGGICPDFISMDLEGIDLEILEAFDFVKYRPKLVVVEVRPRESRDFMRVMWKHGFYLYCRMGENMFFVSSSDRERLYLGA